MRVTGERVLLRKPKRSDIADRQAIGRNGEFVRMCGGGDMSAGASHPPRAFWRKWYRNIRRERHGFVIEYEGRCVGAVKLRGSGKSRSYSIGIFDPALWSQGLGTEATRLMLRHGFESLGLDCITLKVLEFNARGIRCYAKCGFTPTGTRDTDTLMAITRREYELRRDLLLYAISDGNLDAIEAALRGGAIMLQLRAKGLPNEELLALARSVKRITDRYGVPLIINDRADIATQIDAAGAHLGLGDGDLCAARALLGPGKILGATARSVEQALAAQAAGADYLGSGAVFGTSTKVDAVPMPLDLFKEICHSVSIPVVAIGGIDRTNIARLKGCGMAGFAIASGIFEATDVEQAVRELREAARHVL